jgi:hypothetical protein
MILVSIEDGFPVLTPIHGLPDASRRGAGIIGERITGYTGNRRDPVAHGTDVTKLEPAELV